MTIFIVLCRNVVEAQEKIGYIDFGQLIQQMPETKVLQQQIDAYSKQFLDQLAIMNSDYQSKVQAYTAKRSTMTDAERSAKESELTAEQKRMQDYSNSSQQLVEAKTSELAKPLLEKVRAAVAQAAKEKGDNYVINTALVDIIVSPPENDLMAAVKAKLGIK